MLDNFNNSCILNASVQSHWRLDNNLGYHYQWNTNYNQPLPSVVYDYSNVSTFDSMQINNISGSQ